MSLVRHTHELAMELNTMAGVCLGKGFEADALHYYRQAFELEKKAALSTASSDENPLTHFVLLRSAAALAYKAGLYKESENLIEICKSKNPPSWLTKELDDIAKLMKKGKKNSRSKIPDSLLELEGTLTQVNADGNEITVKDVTEDLNFSIIVSKTMLPEIVKNHWSKKVTVQARRTPHGVMVLEKISAAA